LTTKNLSKGDKGVKIEANHLLLRVRSDDGQTIIGHNEVILSKGAAVLGKMGKPVGSPYIDKLNAQIASKTPTFLYLTTREGWNGPYVTYQCTLSFVYRDLPKNKLSLIPKYYASEYKKVTTWFEITSIGKMSKVDMNKIKVTSSGREIMSVISSSAVMFFVSYTGKLKPSLEPVDVKAFPSVKSAEIDLDDEGIDADDFEDVDLSFISSRDAGYDL
jgi:hypothetical protein